MTGLPAITVPMGFTHGNLPAGLQLLGRAFAEGDRNIMADVVSVAAALHIEVNLGENQIDNNIIWDVRNAEPGTPGQRGCAGSGIFINASEKTVIAQNLIGRCDNSGVFAIVRDDRAGTGRAIGNKIYNNIFARCDKSAIVFLDQKNEADGNLYAAMPKGFLGYTTADSKQWLDLPEWTECMDGTRTVALRMCRSTSGRTLWSFR
jgi:hypothetical protein